MKRLKSKKYGHLNYRLFLPFLVTFLFPSCKSNNIDTNDISYVKFYYLPKHTLSPISIDSCKKIYHYHFLKDTIINDRATLDSLKFILSNLSCREDTNYRIDFRLIGMVVLDNGDTIGFCSGEYSGIEYNSRQMEDTPKFFHFIDKVVYIINATTL